MYCERLLEDDMGAEHNGDSDADQVDIVDITSDYLRSFSSLGV